MTRLSKELERRGYKYFDWNVSSSDTVKSNSDDIANTVIRRLKKEIMSFYNTIQNIIVLKR